MVSNQEEATVVVFTPLNDLQLLVLHTIITASTQHGISDEQEAILWPQYAAHSEMLRSKGSACEM